MPRQAEPRSWKAPEEIDLANDRECAQWMDHFDATREELERAVATVGNNPKAVEIWMSALEP